jgi:hypothetical protein
MVKERAQAGGDSQYHMSKQERETKRRPCAPADLRGLSGRPARSENDLKMSEIWLESDGLTENTPQRVYMPPLDNSHPPN